MSEAIPPSVSDAPFDLRHLELIEEEASRRRATSVRIRLATWGMVAGFVALHGSQGQPRYMVLAPMLALAGWWFDAKADHGAQCLGELARAIRRERGPMPPPRTLDASPWSSGVSWRRVLLSADRVFAFHPLASAAALIAVDAARLDAQSSPTELMMNLTVTFIAFVALVAAAWSWWYDNFGDATAPPVMSFAPPAQASPMALAMSSAPGPFPASRDDQRTRPFGTAST